MLSIPYLPRKMSVSTTHGNKKVKLNQNGTVLLLWLFVTGHKPNRLQIDGDNVIHPIIVENVRNSSADCSGDSQNPDQRGNSMWPLTAKPLHSTQNVYP